MTMAFLCETIYFSKPFICYFYAFCFLGYLGYIKSNIANPLALEAIGAFLFTFQNNREYVDAIYSLHGNDKKAYKGSPDIRNFERLSKIRNLKHIDIDKLSLINSQGHR